MKQNSSILLYVVCCWRDKDAALPGMASSLVKEGSLCYKPNKDVRSERQATCSGISQENLTVHFCLYVSLLCLLTSP